MRKAGGEVTGKGGTALATSFLQSESFIYVLYIIAFALFIQGLRGLSGPTSAVRGNRTAAVGMAIAVIATLLEPRRGQLGPDRARPRARDRGGGAGGAQREDDRDAPDGGALQRRRGWRRGADLVGGVPPLRLDLRLAHDPHPRRNGRRRDPEPGGRPTYVAIFSVFAAIVGSISFWGSNIAFGKLQEIIPGRPISFGSAQQAVNLVLLILALAAGIDLVAGAHSRSAVHRHARGRRAARQRGGAADRRRGHAGGDLAAERLHRALRGGDGDGARQPRADRRGHDRRRLGLDPHEPDGDCDEPLDPRDRRRRLRRRRRGGGRLGRGRARGDRALHHRRRRRDPARLRQPRRGGARLRDGGRAGPARGARARLASSSSGGWTSNTRSTPWRGGCRAT